MAKLKEIKKLSPEDRIKKLQELEKKNRQEIEKAQQLIKESEAQIEKEKEIEEMIRDVPVPEAKKVDVSEIWKDTLEEQVKKEEPKLTEKQRQYGQILAETKPIDEITQNVYNMEKGIAGKGYMNQNEQEQLQTNVYALKKKEEEYQKAGLSYEAKKANQAREEADRFLHTYTTSSSAGADSYRMAA